MLSRQTLAQISSAPRALGMRLHMEESLADDTGINDFCQYGVNHLWLGLGGCWEESIFCEHEILTVCPNTLWWENSAFQA